VHAFGDRVQHGVGVGIHHFHNRIVGISGCSSDGGKSGGISLPSERIASKLF